MEKSLNDLHNSIMGLIQSLFEFFLYDRGFGQNILLYLIIIGSFTLLSWILNLTYWILGRWRERTPKM